MHDPIATGKTIEKLRKQAGYTQKSLADALNVTDKAVSKWERGLASPNISLLPKLSALLDADMGALLSGILTAYTYNWKGVLFLKEDVLPLGTLIYDKPMVYFLLSNFLLVGIKEILIICSEKTKKEVFAELKNGESFGIKLIYDSSDDKLSNLVQRNKDFFLESNVFLCDYAFFFFGASLSRQLQGFMSSTEEIIEVSLNSGQKLPLFFIPKDIGSIVFSRIDNKHNSIREILKEHIHEKKMSRGIIAVPFDSYQKINEISNFVGFYQRYHNQEICNLLEISKNRDLIS